MTDVCVAHGGDLSEPSGGTERVGGVVRALVESGREVAVVGPRPTGSLPPAFDAAEFVPVPVTARRFLTQPVRAVLVARRARRLADARDARLQVEHSTLGGVAALLGADGFVLDMHDLASRSRLYGDLPAGRAVQRAIRAVEARALRAAAAVVVVSERMADLVTAEFGVPAADIRVVPNGYDPAVVDPHRGAAEREGRVVFLGTLHRKVDVRALRAVARLPAVTELVVVGDGERRAAVERLAAAEPAVRATGRLPDDEAFPLVASAQVVCNPQRASDLQVASSPVKLYYYAALGRAMVVTRGPELAARLEAAGGAALVDPDAPGAFADAVADLLADEAERDRLGANAREHVRNATWARRGRAFAALYDELDGAISSGGGAP